MTLNQKSELRDILLYRQAKEQGGANEDLRVLAEGARDRLEVYGLDPDALLAQRSVIMERRREEATGVTATLLKQDILMDGHVLPLIREGERTVGFLLVRRIGACIHTPPPPPNQIIHVSYPDGLMLEKGFEAARLSGTLQHALREHGLYLVDGSRKIPASYQLTGAAIAGTPDEIVVASSADADLSLFTRAQIWINSLFASGMTAVDEGSSVKAVFLALPISFA